MSDFDDSASACAIDALSIICKRSTSSTLPFHDIKNDEVTQLFKNIRSGDASRSDLDEASSINALWCGIILVLQSNVYFLGTEDVQTLAAKLPVHVQRFFGAFFSTFELLMEHQRDNRNYLVKSLVLCVRPDTHNVDDTIIQMVRDYKSLFSYAYMFNRRTGTSPISQVGNVTEYFRLLDKNEQTTKGGNKHSIPFTSHPNDPLLLEDDDNDSYDRLMQATTDRFLAPKFGAPSVLPLRPVKLLSDDEHYGSDYQPAAASDLEPDVLYNKEDTNQDSHHLALLNDDSMYSMDGGSILSSYYKYNGWNNTEEEDEDSADDHYQPPVQVARASRMTRMRQQQQQQQQHHHSDKSGKLHDKPKKTKKRLTRRSNKDSIRSTSEPNSSIISAKHNHSHNTVMHTEKDTEKETEGVVAKEPFTYKGGRFRSHEEVPSPTSSRTTSLSTRWNTTTTTGSAGAGEDSGSVQLSGSDGGSSKSSPDNAHSDHRRAVGWSANRERISGRGRDHDSFTESEPEEEDDDDDASDYSVEDHHKYKHSSSVSQGIFNATISTTRSSSLPAGQQRGNRTEPIEIEEVEDFEPFPDDERTPVKKLNSSKYAQDKKSGGSFAPEVHSPSSVGSSIELSDRERRGNTRTNSSEQGRGSSIHGESGRKTDPVGRVHSVLSDEDSDDDHKPSHPTRSHALSLSSSTNPLRLRNPLDASLETPGFSSETQRTLLEVREDGSESEDAPPSRSAAFPVRKRNPLDESLDGPVGAQRYSTVVTRGWAGVKNSQATTVHEVPRSPVVRLPTTSPSKPSNEKVGAHKWETEGDVDLVSTWDSPEISEVDENEGNHSGRPNRHAETGVPHSSSASHHMTATRTTSLPTGSVTTNTDPSDSARRAPHHPQGSTETVNRRGSTDKDQQERAVAIEKMKENIMRRKREKELAAAATGVGAGAGAGATDSDQQEVEEIRLPPSALSRSHSNSRDPSPARDGQPVSILRKSVTFRDQQVADPQHSLLLTDTYEHVLPDKPSERPPLPDRTGSFRMSMRGSVEDTVLFGSRQNSGNWSGEQLQDDAADVSPTPSRASENSDGIGREVKSTDQDLNRGVSVPMSNASRPPLASNPTIKATNSQSRQVQQDNDASPALVMAPLPSSSAGTSVHTSVGAGADRPILSRIPSEQLLMPHSASSPTARAPAQRQVRSKEGGTSIADMNMSGRRDEATAGGPSQTSLVRQSSASSLSASYSNRPLPSLPSLPSHFNPPPLSEFAVASGIICEGYLQKKSAGILGQWQKRYFVLAESTTCFCVLRIFARAVTTAWGTIAVGLHTSIPIYSIEAVETVSTPAAKGKQFTIKFTPRASSAAGGGSGRDGTGSDAGSVFSDAVYGSSGTKITTLMADDAETRMFWVTMLQRTLAIAMDEAD